MLEQNASSTCKYAAVSGSLAHVLKKCAFAACFCSFLFAVGCDDTYRVRAVTLEPEDVTPVPEENVCTQGVTKCGDGADANWLYTCTDALAYDDGVDCTANNSHKICGGNDVKACICDASKGFVETAGGCACDTINHWVESDGSCIKCEGYLFNGQCVSLQGTVKFGNYPQTSDTPEPIEWIVLDAKDRKLLLLSKYVIDVRVYDMSMPAPNDMIACLYPTWAKSEIRSWLNDSDTSGFMSAAFSAEEQAVIVEVTNSTSDYEDNDGGEDSKDKVFLLDYADTVNTDYFKNADALIARATAYVVEQQACVTKPGDDYCEAVNNVEICPHAACSVGWWLRSPSRYETNASCIAFCIIDNNPSRVYQSSIVNTGNMGVRPALWVKY